MSDTSQTAVIRWEKMPEPKRRGSRFDVDATIKAIQTFQEDANSDESQGALIAENVSLSWGSGKSGFVTALKEKGCIVRRAKQENQKYNVYVRYAPEALQEAPKSAKAA